MAVTYLQIEVGRGKEVTDGFGTFANAYNSCFAINAFVLNQWIAIAEACVDMIVKQVSDAGTLLMIAPRKKGSSAEVISLAKRIVNIGVLCNCSMVVEI